MKKAILKTLRDLMSRTVIGFVVRSTLLSMAVTVALLWLGGGMIKSFVQSYLSFIPWEWAQEGLYAIAVTMLGYVVFLAVLSVISSMLSEPLLEKIVHKHYPNIKPKKGTDTTKSLLIALRSSVMFVVVFALSFPLIFVPVVGLLWLLFVWSIPLRAPAVYDTYSFLYGDESIDDDTKETTVLTMISALCNLVPFLSIFTPVFAQIALLHRMVEKKR